MQENVERIKKDKKGSIYAVEFPPDIEKSKRPKTTDSFFNRYLKVSPNDHFEKAPRTSKDKNFVHEHYNQYYRGINCF